MRKIPRPVTSAFVALLLAGCSSAPAPDEQTAQSATPLVVAPGALAPRAVVKKSSAQRLPMFLPQLVVKFSEGTGVRLRAGALVSGAAGAGGALRPAHDELLCPARRPPAEGRGGSAHCVQRTPSRASAYPLCALVRPRRGGAGAGADRGRAGPRGGAGRPQPVL